MCGGDLVIEPGITVCECEYCGFKQTVPSADNEKKFSYVIVPPCKNSSYQEALFYMEAH